jgi:predicted dehydrogenase
MRSLSIWSLSNHFLTKVFPSIKSNKRIKIVSILTNKKKNNFKIKNNYTDRKKIIADKNFDYVYISSINSLHYNYIKFALENNKNVICEKPICLKTKELYNLKKIAKKNKKFFFEVIQYTHHPLFIKLKKLIDKKTVGKILRVESSFKIPLKEKKNFRFNNKLGGGALYDVGYYPISSMFTLFNSNKIKILKSKIIKENKLDISGKLLAKNENKIIFELNWGFKSSYENNIRIFGENGTMNVDFIFSKKIFQGGCIDILNSKKKTIKVAKANQINLAFNSMIFSKKEFFDKRFSLSFNILTIIERLKKNYSKN